MRLHYLQHVPFEGPANFRNWAEDRGHEVTGTHVYREDGFPEMGAFNWLVVMGGPMGVYDEDEYPWLVEEKEFIKDSIQNDKTVIGVCLGAQLVADVLGADVYEHEHAEIGWFPVRRTADTLLTRELPDEYMTFHWHGDTFDLPEVATRLYESEGCRNQAFVYDDGVYGFQFHLEATENSIAELLGVSSPGDGPYIQGAEKIQSYGRHLHELEEYLYRAMDSIEERVSA